MEVEQFKSYGLNSFIVNVADNLFIYLFILYLKVDKHQMQLCTLKK